MTVSLNKTFTADTAAGQALTAVIDIDARIRALQEQRSLHVSVLTDYGTGRHEVEGVGTFTVAESNTYPKEDIAARLTPGQVRRVSRTSIDPAVVKRLYPDVYAAVKRNGGHKVTVRPSA